MKTYFSEDAFTLLSQKRTKMKRKVFSKKSTNKYEK